MDNRPMKTIYDEVDIFEDIECRYSLEEVFPMVTYNEGEKWLNKKEYQHILGTDTRWKGYLECHKEALYESALECQLIIDNLKGEDWDGEVTGYHYCCEHNCYHFTSANEPDFRV